MTSYNSSVNTGYKASPKREAWDEITGEVTVVSGEGRTAAEVKIKWADVKLSKTDRGGFCNALVIIYMNYKNLHLKTAAHYRMLKRERSQTCLDYFFIVVHE